MFAVNGTGDGVTQLACRLRRSCREAPVGCQRRIARGYAQVETRVVADDGVELAVTVLGDGPMTVLFSAGLADRVALEPLGQWLAGRYRVVLPDIRGAGGSRCADPARHGWSRQVADVIAVLDHLRVGRAVVGGAGIGSTIALRVGLEHPERLHAIILAGVEATEVDEHSAGRAAAAAVFAAMADRIEQQGLAATWAPLLPTYPPFIRAMVGGSLPRADPASQAALIRCLATDHAFAALVDLRAVTVAALVIPGDDPRHPAELAKRCAQIMPRAALSELTLSNDLPDADAYAAALAPVMVRFIDHVLA